MEHIEERDGAVKFTAEKGKINVETSIQPESRQLRVAISDTGIGMTREEMGRIFEYFVQGDHASDSGPRRFGGLGLGLAITRKLVESHGGSIAAASEGRDRGATFNVMLPLAAPATAHSVVTARPQPAKADASRSLRILLVEDHEPTRSALSRLLARRRHFVEAAGSVAEARSLASNDRFDLVISDIGLPDGDGCELMALLRRERRLRGIALTGFGMEHDIVRSRQAGFFTHLTKPIRADQLEAAIALAHRDRDGEAASEGT